MMSNKDTYQSVDYSHHGLVKDFIYLIVFGVEVKSVGGSLLVATLELLTTVYLGLCTSEVTSISFDATVAIAV